MEHHDLHMRQDISMELQYVGRRRKNFEKKGFSFPFSMAMLMRFLSQAKAYLDENNHHKVTEETKVSSLIVQGCHHWGR